MGLLEKNKHYNKHLQNSWNKYGKDNFIYEIVEELPGNYIKAKVFERENFHIEAAKTTGKRIFNIARAEGGWGRKTPDELIAIKQKISESVKAAFTEETRAKQRNAKLGVSRTDAEKQKISQKLKGIKKSEEIKIKMRAAQKQRAQTDSNVKENMASIGRLNTGRVPVNAIKFLINGELFQSGREAVEKLNITGRQLTKLEQEGKAIRVK